MIQRATLLGGLALASVLALSAPASEPLDAETGTVAIRAGTIHLVEEGRVLENGIILVRNRRVQAVGTDLDVPPGVQLIDYGPDAVIVPGLVAAYSPYASGNPSPRTAAPELRAVDGFDPYGVYAGALSGGVTSAYITPAENRLISGQGAVVKLAGDPDGRRVVNASACVHGAIDASARNTPGFWVPPIPATVDVGIGYARSQLPRSTMGAIVALDELIGAARGEPDQAFLTEYGAAAATALAALLDTNIPWRLTAENPTEIRALLRWAQENEISLIVDRAGGAAGIADEISAAGAAVVFRVPFLPNADIRDQGKERDAPWPRFDVPARLVEAGARVAIAGATPRDLLFAASLASRGGLDEEAALRAITLTPAEIYGASERIGSISPGKDADLCVLNAPPLSGSASVVATWVDGEIAWSAHLESEATVLQVEELYLGDGRVLRPGQILMRAGEIVEVAERVSRPRGSKLVVGRAAMPGIIDAFGHLGLDGSSKVPATDFAMKSVVGPGDLVDRRVALHGITTVLLAPRGSSKSGAPVMAYKPAAVDTERQVVADPAALRMAWSSSNRLESGKNVRAILKRAAAYRKKWQEYEEAMASWTPPPPEPVEKEADEAEEAEDEKKDEEAKDDAGDKKKKKKKDEKEELEPDPITGVWQAEVARGEETQALRLRLLFGAAEGSGAVEGSLRCDLVSETLVEIEGYWKREEATLDLRGLGTRGWVSVAAKLEEGKLVGTVSVDGEELEVSAERTSKEYVVARRSARKPIKEKKKKDPKGKPKMPKRDAKLEPVKRALEGRLAIVVEVERKDEILECVQAFEAHGIRPILFGAADAHEVAADLVGRVAGILLSPQVLRREADRGTNYRTPYADLQNAGIPVAFHSSAEEGAIQLPLVAAYAVANGMSPAGALRALTADAAAMMSIGAKVGRLERGLDADVLLLDGPPLEPGTSVLRAWVNGTEVRR